MPRATTAVKHTCMRGLEAWPGYWALRMQPQDN